MSKLLTIAGRLPMPIKFRCQHCQQLLGISRSRAGAVVDCPQCGRSLRVPDLDGRTRKLPSPTATFSGDAALVSALSELSALDVDSNQDSPASESNAMTQSSQSHRVIALDPVTNAEPIDTAPAVQARIDDSFAIGEDPVAIEESLEELAAFDESSTDSPVSSELLDEMRQTRSGNGGSFVQGAVFCGVLLAGVAAGWLLNDAIKHPNQPDGNGPVIQSNAGDAASNRAIAATDVLPSAGLEGAVVWLDANGQQNPDVGATVLVLPSERVGSLMLNARSLTREVAHPDRQATLAALSALGGTVADTDEAGGYRVECRTTKPVTVIAISRHKERPEDVSAPDETVQLLNSYFDSTSHLVGRRAIQALTVPAPSSDTPALDFRF